MGRPDTGDIKYCIFDPTGNITAIVETAVDVSMQPGVAARIMETEPAVEQVGFVTFKDGALLQKGEAPVSLRMAGGEFCGNATMCAAALFAIRSGMQGGTVPVKVSGTTKPLSVRLEMQAASSFGAAVSMPPSLSIGTVDLRPADPGEASASLDGSYDDMGAFEEPDEMAGAFADFDDVYEELGDRSPEGTEALLSLPIVEMEGISHIIVEPDSGFFGIKDDSALAEALLREWCGALGPDCLGMMFLAEPRGACERALTPLVYVPGADTMFWENSCASGSAAAGMYLAAKAGKPVDVTFDEPAGRLRVESDPSTETTVLHGSTILLTENSI